MVAGAQEGSPLSGDSAHNGQSRRTGQPRDMNYVRVRDRARVVSERLGGWVGTYNRVL